MNLPSYLVRSRHGVFYFRITFREGGNIKERRWAPIIVGDGEAPPPYTMGDFTPSTVPGCRAPHLWLADGRSLYDAFGPGYTLLRLQPEVDVSRLVDAAQARRMPLSVLDVLPRDVVPAGYRYALVLCRADQHVLWRGDRLASDPAALVAVLCGAAPRPAPSTTAGAKPSRCRSA